MAGTSGIQTAKIFETDEELQAAFDAALEEKKEEGFKVISVRGFALIARNSLQMNAQNVYQHLTIYAARR